MKTKKTVTKKPTSRKTSPRKVVAQNPVTMRTWVLFAMFLAISVYSINIILASQ